jgi:hypothetical protein
MTKPTPFVLDELSWVASSIPGPRSEAVITPGPTGGGRDRPEFAESA